MKNFLNLVCLLLKQHRKKLIVMRNTVLILLISALQVFATGSYAQTKKISLAMNDATIREVLYAIQNQSEFYFLYNSELIDVTKEVDITIEEEKVDAILTRLFDKNEVDFLIKDRYIVLTPVGGNAELFDQRTVSGTVTDESGEPLPGVTVVIKGTTQGTVTNNDGNYSLNNISEEATLVFSFVGMKSQEIEVGTQTAINITMVVDAIGIEEVVAIGYGTLLRKDLTGSVSSIGGEEIVSRGATNPLLSVQGALAGVQITNPTGKPGESPEIIIRGKTSFGGTKPLFVVDGAIVDNIDFLNPNDIESLDVLKDASSNAIYGSRGSNGVVIIETKGAAGAKEGTTTFSFNTYYGIKKVVRMPDFENPVEWMQRRLDGLVVRDWAQEYDDYQDYWNRIFLEDGWAPNGRTSYLATQAWNGNYDGYDWKQHLIKNGAHSNTHFSVAHNHNGSSYVMSVGYQRDEGNIPHEGLKKYNMGLNMNQKLGENLRAGMSINAALTDQDQGNYDAARDIFDLSPITEPWVIDISTMQPIVGELAMEPGGQRYATFGTGAFNPILAINNTEDNFKKWNLFANMFLQYNPLDWITLKTSFSPSLYSERRGRYWGLKGTKDNYKEKVARSKINNEEYFNYSWDNQINIKKSIDEVHNFNALLLQSVFFDSYESTALESKKQSAETSFHNVESGPSSTYDIESGYSQSQILSFAARLNYNYAEKYLLTITARADGSSKFPKENRWDWFPSGAVAWRVTEESFMEDINLINDFKLRYSFGQSGNNSIPSYSTLNVLNRKIQYDFNGTVVDGWYPSRLANKNLMWEKITEHDLGFDFALLNSRISGSFDWYNRVSDRLLVNQQLPQEVGVEGGIRANAASVQNKGVEVVLNTVNIMTKSLRWSTTLTFSKNNNEVLSLAGVKSNDIGNNRFIGQSLDVIYSYVFDGVWQESEAAKAASYGQKPGFVKIKDLNNDGKFTADQDRTFIGSSDPTWEGSLISNLFYKDFDFSFSVFSRQGVLATSGFHKKYGDLQGIGNTRMHLNYWTPTTKWDETNGSNDYPFHRDPGDYWKKDPQDGVGFVKDMSFVKVNNISLGYSLPQRLLSKLNIDKLRVYVNILNPFVFTDYNGYDPEWGAAEEGDTRMSTMTTQFGLNIDF
jgi:TonB-dependent starch-binding outer membrane protein SusC